MEALKHVGVFKIYKILLINICCAFVDLDNKEYKMHSTYMKVILKKTKVLKDLHYSESIYQ